jgi:hypothetical protein
MPGGVGERAAGLPVHPDRVDDVAALIEASPQQGVTAAGWRIENQIQCDGLVPVRALLLIGR